MRRRFFFSNLEGIRHLNGRLNLGFSHAGAFQSRKAGRALYQLHTNYNSSFKTLFPPNIYVLPFMTQNPFIFDILQEGFIIMSLSLASIWQGTKECSQCKRILNTWQFFRSHDSRFQQRPTKQCKYYGEHQISHLFVNI